MAIFNVKLPEGIYIYYGIYCTCHNGVYPHSIGGRLKAAVRTEGVAFSGWIRTIWQVMITVIRMYMYIYRERERERCIIYIHVHDIVLGLYPAIIRACDANRCDVMYWKWVQRTLRWKKNKRLQRMRKRTRNPSPESFATSNGAFACCQPFFQSAPTLGIGNHSKTHKSQLCQAHFYLLTPRYRYTYNHLCAHFY